MTESFRLRHVNWIVGLFLLLVIAVALGSILAYIFVTDTYGPKLSYRVDMSQEELGSLKKNADVFLLGEIVGKVNTIEFRNETHPPAQSPDKDLIVTLRIKKAYEASILEGSTVVLRTPLAVGNAHLEIIRGPANRAKLATNEITPAALPLEERDNPLNDVGNSVGQGMAQIVDNFDRARSAIVWGMGALQRLSQTTERGVDPALEEMRKAIAELRATTARTEVTLKHTLEDIAETSRTMNDRTKSSSTNLDTNIEEMEQSIADVNHNMKVAIEKLNRDLAASLSKFNLAMDNFNAIAADIKVVTQDLPTTVDGVNNSIEDADDVISGVKRHPLLKNVVPQDQGTRQAAPASVRGGSGS
jgi:ABC-type transporter Mla subunit MlaD